MEMVMAEEMETSKSGSRSDSLVFVKPDTNRMLKRSINTLAIDGKLNEDVRSPARKEVRISHEAYMRREVDQWKQLMDDQGLQKSVSISECNNADREAVLKPDQQMFIEEAIDIQKMLEESENFRLHFDFFLRVNKVKAMLMADKSNELHDQATEKELSFRTKYMNCEQFNPMES